MGYFRILLALIVMVAHLGPRESLWPELMWWRWAVFAFYAISGYLMVLLTQGPYKEQRWGFLFSRALRTYPVYWAVLALSLLGYAAIGGQSHFQQWMGWPMPGDLLLQILLIINIDSMPFVAAPIAWALSVEMAWWIAIAFGIFDQRRQTYCLLALACVAYLYATPDYYSLRWGFVPFALGGAAYWSGLQIPRDGQWACWAGALSYPVFLSHYQLGAFISDAYELERSWPLFFAALPPTMALSWLLVVAVERPISNFRKTLRRIPHG